MKGPIAPWYGDDERLTTLLGPGGAFEVEEVVIDAVPLRSFVRAPAAVVDAFRMTAQYQESVHLVFEDERLTFGSMRSQALSVARQLRSTFGIRPGDRMAITMRNYPEFFTSFWAAVLIGAIVVPLNAWWTGEELLFAVEDSGASLVVVDDERLERLLPLRPRADLVAVRTTDPGKVSTFESLASGPLLPDDEYACSDPDDPVTILYTSGTTGRPKGAIGTNRAIIASLRNTAFATERERLLSGRPPGTVDQPASLAATPLFHAGGVGAVVGGALSGSKVVLMRKWDVDEAVMLAKRENVTSLGGVPTMARELLEYPDLGQMGLGIQTFRLGGTAVSPDLPRRVTEVLGESVQVINGYGLTETMSSVVVNAGWEYAQRPDSVGRANLTADIKVCDSSGHDLEVSEVGELCFRSPQVAKGYWNRPEDTASAFVDGWFRTGDLGYVDEQGYVYVVDRIKDVVIRGGENVYSAEVEVALCEHPAIADLAVVGIPDDRMGERVCAVVVPRSGHTIDITELRRFASNRLAGFMCPEALVVVPELPKTATGKVAKQVVRSMLKDSPNSSGWAWQLLPRTEGSA